MDGWEYTVADYVRLEAENPTAKYEFVYGQIRLMAGGTPEHAALAAAFVQLLYQPLRGSTCRVYTSDLRLRSVATGIITYPDVSVICGPPIMDTEDPLACINPTLLVEVTSKSSERYDHTAKRELYQLIDTVREYVIVSHRARAVHVFTRADDGTWAKPTRYLAGQRARLQSLGCEIDVDELYAGASSAS